MKQVSLGPTSQRVPAVIAGCMRWNTLNPAAVNRLIHAALDLGVNYFDHADIYGGGRSEEIFAQALHDDSSISRDRLILQSKCGIRTEHYDSSRDYILLAVDGILRRLHTDYLDVLLLHRPDALVEPEEVAEAFDRLYKGGKVRHFGVSNYRPLQMELLQKYLRQPLAANQLQLSLPMSGMISAGLEANMTTEGAADRDGSVLDWCRLHRVTIQAWSPFQGPNGTGTFLGSNRWPKLNQVLEELAWRYGVSATAIASAWILRHPAGMQVIAGTTRENRLKEVVQGASVQLRREEWYRLYLAAGHILP